MRLKQILSTMIIVTAAFASHVPAQKNDGKLPTIDSKTYKLKNGLSVILHRDPSTPIVSVGTWYHVGSKNEAPGRTGFAHLFEHMMFQGSANYDNDYFTPLQEAGGSINGTTNEDRTWYYETVPANFLELALFMEADRLGNLLPAMTQEKLDNQRDVVKNERRQRVDNQPYGDSFERIGSIMFPKGHPYNWSVIGSLEDLQAASMDDVKSFFRQYYIPQNTYLVVSGDFEEAKARGWIEKYFGAIEKGGEISRPSPPMPKLDKELRETVEATVPFNRRYLVWHGVSQYSKDEPALDFLQFILSSGRTSRLQSNLLYEKEMVQQISAFSETRESGGLFQIQATARPGKNLDDIEKEVDAEIAKIKATPPTAEEMTRAMNSIESQSIYGLQTVLGKAARLATFEGYLGKADWFQADLDRYRAVTPADVQRAANTYLGKNRLVLSYVPRTGEAARGSRAANQVTSNKAEKKDQARIDAQAAKLPKPGPDPKIALPTIEKTKLRNGLEVWMVEQRELPLLSMNLVFKTGQANEPQDRRGVAGATAQLLDDGTKKRSATEIANALQSIGASINAGSGWDSTNVSMQTLTKNLDAALDIYTDVVLNPEFPATEFESLRARQLVALRQQRANANAISNLVFNKVLYGEHPYGRDNNEATIKAITRDDIVKFYSNNYRPNNATLIVAGSFDKKQLRSKLEAAFSGWESGAVTATSLPTPAAFDQPGIYIVDRPNSAQSVVAVGQIGVDRMNPDYHAIQVMNSILGGGITSRISMNLREEKGYTYGAGSGYTYRRGPGPFRAGGDIQTAVTKEAVIELMNEIKGIRDSRPVTQRELDYNKQSIIRRYPAGFETVGQLSNQLSNLVVYGLPDNYFDQYIAKINAVTLEDVNRVAKKYLDPDKMAIVIVGDRTVIEPGLKELGMGIRLLDTEGMPVAQ